METSPIMVDWDSGHTWEGHFHSAKPTMVTSPIMVDWDSGYTWEGHWDSAKPTMETSPIMVDWDSGYLGRTLARHKLVGTPLGTPEFQATHLQATTDQHSTLLQRIPAIQDLQAEWLLLLYCASPRCKYLLRMLRPEITQPFAQAHYTAITLALAQLLDMEGSSASLLSHSPSFRPKGGNRETPSCPHCTR